MRRLLQFGLGAAGSAFIVLVLLGQAIHAQELDPRDPVYIGFGVERADVVISGTFKVAWFYPWFDGWHYSGAIKIDDVLYGDHRPKETIQFRWLERYGNQCLVCERVSLFNDKSGIWLLTKAHGSIRFSGTAATFCGGPLPLDAERTVMAALERKRTTK